jgi:hypothetical protein
LQEEEITLPVITTRTLLDSLITDTRSSDWTVRERSMMMLGKVLKHGVPELVEYCNMELMRDKPKSQSTMTDLRPRSRQL